MSPTRLLLDEFVPYRLSFTSNLVSETIAGAYGHLFGLSIPQWRLLAVLAETQGVSQQEIGQRTRMDKVTVSRAAIALTARDLIEKTANLEDRRSHRLTLTRIGWRLYNEVAPKAIELEAALFGSFTAEEILQFVSVLRRIDQAALEALDSPRTSVAGSGQG